MKGILKTSAVLAGILALATAAQADEAKPKRSLKGNMQVVYNQLPGEVDSFDKFFSEGMVYGRLRMNNFKWDWSEESAKNKSNHATGIGGSVIYKTAQFKGFSASTGFYYSHGGILQTTDTADMGFIKAGKDVLSRYDVKNIDNHEMTVLGEANLQYQFGKNSVIAGRQMIETVLTKSNDTKMIPNTFDGIVVENKDIPATTLRIAHFVAQKLRDHTKSHDVITYQNSDGENWANNDDSAIHKGLSYANFEAADKDTDHTLSILTAKSKIGENLKTEVSYLMLPDVINALVLEANYAFKAGDTKITPGIRYYLQMDDGGGAIGGPSLKGDVTTANAATKGYTVGDSLDSSMTAVRVDIQPSKAYKFRLGYTAIADKADLVAPWRGFPTAGYTRAMAQYNWTANTKTTMARVDVDLGKLNLLPRTSFLVRYAVQDFDDAKSGVQADTTVLHTDWVHNLPMDENLLQVKYRMAVVDGEAKGSAADNSYSEYRLEINYLF